MNSAPTVHTNALGASGRMTSTTTTLNTGITKDSKREFLEQINDYKI